MKPNPNLRPWEESCVQRGFEDYQKGQLQKHCPFCDWRARFWLRGWLEARAKCNQVVLRRRENKKKGSFRSLVNYAKNEAAHLRNLAKAEAEAQVSAPIQAEFKEGTRKKTKRGILQLLEIKWRDPLVGNGSERVRPEFDKLMIQSPTYRKALGPTTRNEGPELREWLTGAPEGKKKSF